MLRRWLKSIMGMTRTTEGSAAMEFSLMLPAFLLIMGSILDFGHAWYMQQAITNASREGARYGINYATNSNGVRIAASGKSPSIETVVKNRLTDLLPSDAAVEVECGGTGFSATNPSGLPLDVTVTAIKKWWMLSCLLGESKTIAITTTMNCE
jgi:Flp pilus assembly protein TadG